MTLVAQHIFPVEFDMSDTQTQHDAPNTPPHERSGGDDRPVPLSISTPSSAPSTPELTTSGSPNSDHSATFNAPSARASNRNLHIDNLAAIDDAALKKLFAVFGPIVRVRVASDAATGEHSGYGFVQFELEDDAQKAIVAMDGQMIQVDADGAVTLVDSETAERIEAEENTQKETDRAGVEESAGTSSSVAIPSAVVSKRLRVTMARNRKRLEYSHLPNTNLYVAGLPHSFTKVQLDDLFAPFGNILDSRILSDRVSGLSRGVGFVRFDNLQSCSLAIRTWNGRIPPACSHAITVRYAVEKATTATATSSGASGSAVPVVLPYNAMAQSLAQYEPMSMPPMIPTNLLTMFMPMQMAISMPPYPMMQQISPHSPTSAQEFRSVHRGSGSSTTSAASSDSAISPPGFSAQQQTVLYHNNLMIQQHMQQQQHSAISEAHTHAQPSHPYASTSPLSHVDGPTLFVYHLPVALTEATLHDMFSVYGAVASTAVIRDPQTGMSRGYGFVNMIEEKEAVNAIHALNGFAIAGKYLSVSFKKKQ